MSDDLDNKSDAELNELFAVEVAGWQVGNHGLFWDSDNREAHIIKGGLLHQKRTAMGLPSEPQFCVDFCTDANAVLLWLEKGAWNLWFEGKQWYRVTVEVGLVGEYDGHAPTFARAAVLALIRGARAKRASK